MVSGLRDGQALQVHLFDLGLVDIGGHSHIFHLHAHVDNLGFVPVGLCGVIITHDVDQVR